MPFAVTITVEKVNHAPVADAGSDSTQDQASVGALTAAGSSGPDGDPITYIWQQVFGPPVLLSDAIAIAPAFTAPVLGPGEATLVCEPVASDGSVGSPPDSVTITIVDVNDPPACRLAVADPTLLWPPRRTNEVPHLADTRSVDFLHGTRPAVRW